MSGNIHGVSKYDCFSSVFCEIIGVIMSFEPSLVVIPYPSGEESNKGHPFTHKPSTLVSSWKCKVYINAGFYITNGKSTTVKVFVGRDLSAAIFNWLESGQLADEKDRSVRVCHIQASKVVVTGYLQGSTNTLNDEHLTKHYNALYLLCNLVVKVQICNIDDPTGKPLKFGSKNKCFVANILCAENNTAEVNHVLGNTYGKERTASRAAGSFPEGRAMKYVPYNSTGVIKRSPELFCQLQKTRLLHSWNQQNDHTISMRGFNDLFRGLIAPNSHEFTICQVIMFTKCSYDFITPLFIGVDVSPEGEVVYICSLDMKVEAESLLSHFGLYVAYIFGSVVLEAFTMEYKLKMDCYQYYPTKNCAI